MNERSYLTDQIVLEGEDKRQWRMTVMETVQETEESITYRAMTAEGQVGLLKECYPASLPRLHRLEEGYLVLDDDAPWLMVADEPERLATAERAFRIHYQQIEMLRQTEEEVRTLFPEVTLLRGMGGQGWYAWISGDIKSLASISHMIQKEPSEQSQMKLITLLKMLLLVTKGFASLEKIGYTYTLSPEEIGFEKRGEDLRTESIRIREIDGLRRLQPQGKNGLSLPVEETQAIIQFIGENLLASLRLPTRSESYIPEYDPYFARIVEESPLLSACEANRHPRLQKMVTLLLQRCLSHRNKRYTTIQEVMSDLEETLQMALPTAFASQLVNGQPWRVQSVLPFLLREDKSAMTVIARQLYEHPLCELEDADESLSVLVLGFGQYGQAFLDSCLQCGSMATHNLSVTVGTKDLTDREIYLEKRPELGEFFNIDERKNFEGNLFGSVKFAAATFELENGRRLQQFVQSKFAKKGPQCAFVALGDDALTISVARTLKVLLPECQVSAAIEGETIEAPDGVSVMRMASEPSVPFELEQVANNVSYVWNQMDVPSFDDRRRYLSEQAYREAGLIMSVSLKYLLYHVEIDWTHRTVEEVARLYAKKVEEEDSGELRHYLAAMLHRCWVTEKLCQGWRRISTVDEWPQGTLVDYQQKRHLCLKKNRLSRHSEEERLSPDKWEEATKFELKQLDDLDCLSVEWHCHFKRRANDLKKRNPLESTCCRSIRQLIEGHPEAIRRFEDWRECIKSIWNGHRQLQPRYQSLKGRFLEAITTLPSEVQQTINRLIHDFDALFIPVLLSTDYREFREHCGLLVQQIPYILTYTEQTHLVVPLSEGTPTDIFANVAAASLIRPFEVTYLHYIHQLADFEGAAETLRIIRHYYDQRRLHLQLHLGILLSDEEIARLYKEQLTQYQDVANELGYHVFTFTDMNEVSGQSVCEYLKQAQQRTRKLAIEQNETWLSAYLQGLGLYREHAYYQFDAAEQTFSEWSAGEQFAYILDKPSLTVQEVVGFSQLESATSQHPEFFDDYQFLWKKYMENSKTWKLLCRVLETHDKNHHQLLYFRQKDAPYKQREETYRYVVPNTSRIALQKIIDYLVKYRILEEGSVVYPYTTEACEVLLKDRMGNRELYDILLAQCYKLMVPDAIHLYFDEEDRSVRVLHDQLTVMNVMIDGNRYEEICNLLQYFEKIGYIIRLKVNQDRTVNFTYATHAIKELLTTAGKILEVYTYHKIKELGQFDDVVSSCEIQWQDSEVTNEFDCIMTKGFKTIIVECKARRDIEQNFYYKLLVLSQKFGIHPTVVLIADTQEVNNVSAHNAMQRERGSMMDVVTIWKPQEITAIGQTLLAIANSEQ